MITADGFLIDACTAIFVVRTAPNGDPIIDVYPHGEVISADTSWKPFKAANEEGGG